MDSQELKVAIDQDPLNTSLRAKYARTLFEESNFDETLVQLQILLKANIEVEELSILASRAAHAKGDTKRAGEFYQQARNQHGAIEDSELEPLYGDSTTSPSEENVLKLVKGGEHQIGGSTNVISFARDESAVSFSDVVGMADLKKKIKIKIIQPFTNPSLFQKFKKKAGGGVLLYGPPGCGKTLMARAVATELGANFFPIGISDVLNMYIGESERNLALHFEKARQHKPSVLFFDELDALAYSRSKASSEHTRSRVNQFLNQLDGLGTSNEQVLVLGATNMPWDIDPAMKRPGRFAQSVFVPPPDEEARAEMFRVKLHGVPCQAIDFQILGANSPAFSGADIDGVIDLAKEELLEGILDTGIETKLSMEHLLNALKNAEPSTLEWMKTASNLVKFAGADKAYKEVADYLRSIKQL